MIKQKGNESTLNLAWEKYDRLKSTDTLIMPSADTIAAAQTSSITAAIDPVCQFPFASFAIV